MIKEKYFKISVFIINVIFIKVTNYKVYNLMYNNIKNKFKINETLQYHLFSIIELDIMKN